MNTTLSINESLVVKAFAKSQQVKLALNTITDVRQIEDILEKLEHVEEVSCQNTQSLPQLIINATNQLRTAVSNLEEENELVHDYTNRSDILPHLQFIFNQLENLLVPKNHRRYNLITLVMSLVSANFASMLPISSISGLYFFTTSFNSSTTIL